MILLVVSIRQKNPKCVDRASSTTRLYVTHTSRRNEVMINITTGDHTFLAMLRWTVMVLGHTLFNSEATGCSLWDAHSWTFSPFLAKSHTWKGGGSF
jgi:hypothetical protein